MICGCPPSCSLHAVCALALLGAMAGTGVRAATAGFGVVCAASVAAIAFVHRQQAEEQQRLHEGVAKDAKRMKWRQSEIAKQQAAEQAQKQEP